MWKKNSQSRKTSSKCSFQIITHQLEVRPHTPTICSALKHRRLGQSTSLCNIFISSEVAIFWKFQRLGVLPRSPLLKTENTKVLVTRMETQCSCCFLYRTCDGIWAQSYSSVDSHAQSDVSTYMIHVRKIASGSPKFANRWKAPCQKPSGEKLG